MLQQGINFNLMNSAYNFNISVNTKHHDPVLLLYFTAVPFLERGGGGRPLHFKYVIDNYI